MSRPLVILAVVLLLLATAVAFLAGRSSERPVTRVEQPVSLDNLV